jgi:hypothetical protein
MRKQDINYTATAFTVIPETPSVCAVLRFSILRAKYASTALLDKVGYTCGTHMWSPVIGVGLRASRYNS